MRPFSTRPALHKNRGLAVAFAAALVAGCTAQPLYAPQTTVTGSTLANPEFSGMVSFDAPDSRIEQVVRNAMIFQLNGGGVSAAPNPVFNASLAVTNSSTGRFRVPTSTAGQTSAAIVTVQGTLTLADASTGEAVKTIQRSAIAPYDKTSQDFANERAELDAENRAANEVAEQLSALLAIELRKRR